MCGIIGCVGEPNSIDVDVVVDCLENLEYRGYDSAGVGLLQDDLVIEKRTGELARLDEELDDHRGRRFQAGIGHTRWSTHGPPTDDNAHPHVDCDGRVAVVHNGIIGNHESVTEELVADGHEFTSGTDSEIVPHLVEEYLADGYTPLTALRSATLKLTGSFSVLMAVRGFGKLYAARNGSPIVLGTGDDVNFVASDVPAILDHTEDVVYLEDGDVAEIAPDDVEIRDSNGNLAERKTETISWEAEEAGKGGFEHYMLKEIHEQPEAVRGCLDGRIDELRNDVDVGIDVSASDFDGIELVGAGTSYHACLYAASLLRGSGVPATAVSPGEHHDAEREADEGLAIFVSQSGESSDVLDVAREMGAVESIAVTNVFGSSLSRECDHTVYVRAGPEIGVAATKTFTGQAITLNLLHKVLTGALESDRDFHPYFDALRNLDGYVRQDVASSTAASVAAEFAGSERFFVLGKGLNYPAAREGSLKLREVSYVDTYGYRGSELKHGPLALVTSETPVVALVTGGETEKRDFRSQLREIRSRGAPIIAISDGAHEWVDEIAREVLEVQETHPELAPLMANVQLQLLSYHVARELGRPIDKPRNLAKSVNVE
ncbi:glutamine--fructose-6-phosphate transaminase (isomerizing) [Halorarum halobium]|uniref:glutamine--fructose-6-phosphate transaminase (isomerizing) n=1 Tax=Halorarum halobium TaxID=3075121 RepID=UPI0028AAEBD8|nr:glutamine--fructose-6-phosphate transaminase (isomerizing) [Halobaculum sp. XH14]